MEHSVNFKVAPFWLTRALILLTIASVTPISAGPVAAASQGPARDSAQHPGPAGDPAPIERWRGLTPDRRRELRRRFEELRAMPPEERKALMERARTLARIERELVLELTAEQRQRLAGMSSQTRSRVVREMASDRARNRAERLREALPEEQRRRLERADPVERRRFFEELRRSHAGKVPQFLERLSRELELTEEQKSEISHLAPAEKKRRLFELVHQRAQRWVQENGLPDELSAEQWERMQHLPPHRFAHHLMRLRGRLNGTGRGFGQPFGPPPGVLPERRPGGPPPFAGGPPPDTRPGSRPGMRPGQGPGDPRGRYERPSLEVRQRLRRLREASAPTAADRLELADVSPRERVQRLSERRRGRVLDALREMGVTVALLEKLRSLPMREFREASRKAVGLRVNRGRRTPPAPRRD